MDAVHDLRAQCRMYGTVLRKPAHASKLRCGDRHIKMAFPHLETLNGLYVILIRPKPLIP